MSEQYDFPAKECDLVMKGGVTSGIVYPYAIMKLKDDYRFVSIGGTSAGAVAAAVVAAAEHGRQYVDEQGKDGFARLQALTDDFSGKLFTRFGAPKGTRPILALLHATGAFGGLNKKRTAFGKLANSIRSLAQNNTIAFVAGALIGLGLGVSFIYGIASLWSGLVSRLPSDWVASWNSGWGGWAGSIVPVLLGLGVGYLLRNFLGQLLKALAGGLIGGLLLLGVGWLLDNWFDKGDWTLLLGIFVTLLLGVLGAVLGGFADLALRVFAKEVPRNGMGIVNGHDRDYKKGEPILLTDYLYEGLNELAGLKGETAPLTFGQLCAREIENTDHRKELKSITLEMITTNVSQGIPYRLPFKSHIFLFKRSDMLNLFPWHVVQHMIDKRYRSSTFSDQETRKALAEQAPGSGVDKAHYQSALPDGYFFLPDPDDFPVVVAMRMSLAIPVFFSAIPLYTIKPSSFVKAQHGHALDAGEDFQKHFFSDGGTTSNFPIQSFDRWLPTRPTFGIDLSYMQEEPKSDGKKKTFSGEALSLVAGLEGGENVDNFADEPPASGRSSLNEVELGVANAPPETDWRRIENPIAFLMRVVDTARENHDNLQAALPGYRERIVTVRLSPKEGGMNLDMDNDIIYAMKLKGQMAGLAFSKFSFDHHRWTRFVTLMSQLEFQLQKFRNAFKKRDYASMLVRDPGEPTTSTDGFPYRYFSESHLKHKAYHYAASLIKLLDDWEDFSKGNFPQPDFHDRGLRQFTPVVNRDAKSPKPTLVDQANCGTADDGITFYLFNQPNGQKDQVPKPKSVLRVTPDN